MRISPSRPKKSIVRPVQRWRELRKAPGVSMAGLSPNPNLNAPMSKHEQELGTPQGTTRQSAPSKAGLIAGQVSRQRTARLSGERHRQEAEEASCSAQCLLRVSRFMLGHCFGVKPTPGGRLVLLLRLSPPSVTASIEILFGKSTEKIIDGPTVNAELRPWESDPLAWLRRV